MLMISILAAQMIYHSSWRSPSNIALVKYWGKYGQQLPRNPSLSFTLSTCHTEMRLEVSPASALNLHLFYDGNPMPAFLPKVQMLFNTLQEKYEWIRQSEITIHSINTFPHAAGIASSASSMSALALCLLDIDQQQKGETFQLKEETRKEASSIARIGSGSACRSLFPVASIWGETDQVPGSSNEFAIPYAQMLDPVFQNFRDTILITHAGEKSVSSSAGHKLMEELAYADTRYKLAANNLTLLLKAMSSGDLDTFISIVESEALQLHALMMSGPHPYILMKPATLSIIEAVWDFRRQTQIPVCFTLDAGPNVHLLYPEKHIASVMTWVKDELSKHCIGGRFIEDFTGQGPERIA